AKGAAADPEGTQRAKDRFEVRKREAEIGYRINEQNIQNKAINDNIATSLAKISFEYDVILRKIEIQNARTDGALRLEQERLRILREAAALPEPKLVEMETAAQQAEIQSRYDQARKSAETAAQKERDELD
ncbi:hypothetical protein BSN82_18080, partial [Acinetobacter baylyi]|uniref:hypothetical protein n=1 Tax=Acinetobacter baylyi TaxID=202950 RepID=UPI0013D706A3